jgi:hypothetical protein
VDTGNVNPPNSALAPDNVGWAYSVSDGYIIVNAANAVIDGISDTGGISVPAGTSLTVKNSQIGLINHQGTSLVVDHCTIKAGNQFTYSSVTGGQNITVRNSDLSGGGHEVLCYGNCVVQDSWLHDNADGAAAGAHQNGFLTIGGSAFTLTHNAVYCVGGCTADISFLGSASDANVSKNLLVASPDSAFCVYPGPNADPQSPASNNMVWTDNVFQHGANSKCATYGPVYGWYPQLGTGNVWSGNTWDDGTVLTP